MNACASRGGVDHIDEASEIFYEDGGRDGEAGHADVADFGGYDGGRDGAVGSHRFCFYEHCGFHGVWSGPKLRCACIGLRSLRPFGAGFGVAINGGMREVARLTQIGDVPLSGFFRDAERSGGFEVG